ncbi:MAG: hypothetical protein HGA65_08025 [Oscillochloris sp.]|nr:hypothetical protein [Oscillochloris sp.]
MKNALEALTPQIEAAIATALRQNLMTNRGTFAPFRVGSTAKAIINAIVHQSLDEIEALGQSLSRDGLSLASLIAAQTATLRVVAETTAPGALIVPLTSAFGALITGQSKAYIDEIRGQFDEMERAFRKVIAEQQEFRR